MHIPVTRLPREKNHKQSTLASRAELAHNLPSATIYTIGMMPTLAQTHSLE